MFGLDLKDTTQLLLSIAAFVTSIAAWLRRPGEDAQTALQAHITTEFSTLAARTTTIEERLKHMPTSAELSELEGTVKQMDERTKGMNVGMDRMRVQLDRIEYHLLNSKTEL